MNTYYDYLEESTNVVKSNTKRNKTVTILSYLMIWTVSMLVFWVFKGGIDAMGYSLTRREQEIPLFYKWWDELR